MISGDIAKIVKKTVHVKIYHSDDLIENGDVLLVSQNDSPQFSNTSFPVYVYEEILNQIPKNISNEYIVGHSYYHLQKAISKAKQSAVQTLIVGSSYPFLGLIKHCWIMLLTALYRRRTFITL